jgi:DNA-binding NtrC family response regulator
MVKNVSIGKSGLPKPPARKTRRLGVLLCLLYAHDLSERTSVKIVLVAESGFTRSSVNVNLRSAGHEVTEAEPTSLTSVLMVMREVLPHLVVMDYEIPLCHCETVVRIVREDPILSRTPMLVIVDSMRIDGVDRMSRWEQLRFLQKPLQVEALLQAVQDQFPTLSTNS